MGRRSWIVTAAASILLAGWMGLGSRAAAEDQEVQVQLQPYQLEQKTSDPVEVINAPVPKPPPVSPQGPGANGGAGADPDTDGKGGTGHGPGVGSGPGTVPGSGSGGHPGGNGGGNTNGNSYDVGPYHPGGQILPGVNIGSSGGGSGNGSGYGPAGPVQGGIGGYSSGAAGSGGYTGGTVDPSGKNNLDGPKDDGSQGKKKESKKHHSFWGGLWDKAKEKASGAWDHVKDAAKKVGRGLVVGAIGAGIAVGVVVGAAALVGIAISAPVILVGLGVGLAAGVVYSFVAGDHFSFVKGVAISGVAALAGMAVAQGGALAALRTVGGWLGRGGSLLKNGFSAFKQAPWAFLRGHVFNAGVYYNFGASFAWNLIDFGLRNDWSRRPTLSELGGMMASSALSAVVFGKLSSALSAARKSWFTKRLTEGAVSMAESAITNPLKGYPHTASGYLAGFLSSFLPKPVSNLFKKLRVKKQIGTTIAELNQKGIVPQLGRKVLTNKSLDQLYKLDGERGRKLVEQLRKHQGQLTQRQLDRLLQNTRANERLMQRKEILGLGEKAVKKEVTNLVLKPAAQVVTDNAHHLTDQLGNAMDQLDGRFNQAVDKTFGNLDSKMQQLLNPDGGDEILKKAGTAGK